MVGIAGLMLGMMMVGGGASSHREAPLIANDPQADNTDLYAWVNGGNLNILAAYFPGQNPAGGFPNGFAFADEVLYTINIDSDGDGIANLRFGFDFTTKWRNQQTLYQNISLLGDLAVTSAGDVDQNMYQEYRVGLTKSNWLPVPGNNGVTTLTGTALTSPNNVGPATHAGTDFATIMQSAVTSLSSSYGRAWAGQADDPFFVDLGAIYDVAQLRTITGDNGGQGIDSLADFNAQVIALEIPIAKVTRNGMLPTGPNDRYAAVGIWAANYRPQITTLKPTIVTKVSSEPKNIEGNRPTFSGNYVLVSRLGMPLSNEAIILVGEKDRWNRTEPQYDGQYLSYYQNSHLAVLLNAVHGTPGATTGRIDIVTIFLTGIPGLNMVADSAREAVYSDMLRINLAAPSGFPNGRLLSDDIVDVSLSIVGLSDGTLGGLVTSGISDGVGANDLPFQSIFPYVAVPHSAYDFDTENGGD
jgi:hypothetical protein